MSQGFMASRKLSQSLTRSSKTSADGQKLLAVSLEQGVAQGSPDTPHLLTFLRAPLTSHISPL